jgi:hypothetical protein
METLKLQKRPIFRVFLIQYGEILGLETGLVLCYHYIDFSFYVFQLLLIPIFFLLIFSKYNKSITSIIIDCSNKIFKIKQDYFLVLTKDFEIPFVNVYFQVRWKWLMNFYSQVIEIKENGKLIAVIPLKGSIWSRNELRCLINKLNELSNKNEIKADLSSYISK